MRAIVLGGLYHRLSDITEYYGLWIAKLIPT